MKSAIWDIKGVETLLEAIHNTEKLNIFSKLWKRLFGKRYIVKNKLNNNTVAIYHYKGKFYI